MQDVETPIETEQANPAEPQTSPESAGITGPPSARTDTQTDTQPPTLSPEIKKELKHGLLNYIRQLFHIHDDMMSASEIEEMMQENTVIHGSNM